MRSGCSPGGPSRRKAPRLGRPLGVLCAIGAAGLTTLAVRDADGFLPPLGPLTGPAAVLVALCAAATLLTSAVESRQSRTAVRDTLNDLGTPERCCVRPSPYARLPCSPYAYPSVGVWRN